MIFKNVISIKAQFAVEQTKWQAIVTANELKH